MRKAFTTAALVCWTSLSVSGQLLQYVQFDEPARRYLKVAAPGNELARLAQRCLNGQGITQDYEEFARQIVISADDGDQWAQLMLGLAYIAGRGVPADYVAGHMWSSLAAAGGDERLSVLAREQRNALSAAMSRRQIAQAQELARNWKPRSLREAEEPRQPVKKRRLLFWRR